MNGLNSPSRLAFAAVVLILIGVGAWLFWPDKPEYDSSVSADKTLVVNEIRDTIAEAEPKSVRAKAESKQVEEPKKVPDFRLDEGEEFATLKEGSMILVDGVTDLVPGNPKTDFGIGERVHVFAAINSPQRETIRFTWYGPGGKEVLPSSYLDVEPNIGDVGFRVFTYRVFREVGEYRVELSNSVGQRMGQQAFRVK